MIAKIIEYSVKNRLLVLLLAGALVAAGVWATFHLGLDAIPDLSDVQVIVVTDYPGQNPQVVDDQVTYPLTTAMLAVSGSTAVRGYSMFGVSFVYVLFKDGTKIDDARARVLEYLNFARQRLPDGVVPRLGPDASGVGWVYQYVLYPGWYCPDHPKGLWQDVAQGKWYAKAQDAPADRRNHLTHVRAFQHAGACPLDGQTLKAADQDLGRLRALQDWYLRYPLTAVAGVAEVAPIGGFVRQYQVALDPVKLRAYRLPVGKIVDAIRRSNNDVGGGVIEMSETEYMVRSRSYIQTLDDLGNVVVGMGDHGTPILLRDVAHLQIGGQDRRGIGEINGQGEAVGGIVIARYGADAYRVIAAAKAKLGQLEQGLPPGVFVLPTYDRSKLIERSIHTLRHTLIEEMIIVALVCILFLLHARSALVALFVLPAGVLASLLVMDMAGVNANIMSLGGIAIAIGVMIDSAVVMVENAHKHLEHVPPISPPAESPQIPAGEDSGATRERTMIAAAVEVGPTLFFSLLIITVAFLPVFVLGGQSGRLFTPLAFTKTFAMAAAAILSVTVIPVLMYYFIKGKIISEARNPVSRLMRRLYEPPFQWSLRHRWLVLLIAVLALASALWPATHLGTEFMPPLDEGDLLYMPTTDPGIGISAARSLLQQTDKLIKKFPEVLTVHGKIGRAQTATDPAPLSMIESVVQLKTDPAQWRKRKVRYFFSHWPNWLKWPLTHTYWPESRPITMDELKYGWIGADGVPHEGLNQAVDFPGVANAWPYPIENRLNMLSTGIKTPVGIMIQGPDLNVLSRLAEKAAAIVRPIAGTLSAYPDRTMGGHYLDMEIDRAAAARYGLTSGDVQETIQTAIGGKNITTIVKGQERYPLSVRYQRELRDDPEALKRVLVSTPSGAQIPLGQLAKITIHSGPPMIRSDGARHTAIVYIDVSGRDLGSYVEEARRAVVQQLKLPDGYTVVFAGEFQQWEKTLPRLVAAGAATLLLIILLLYMGTRSWFRVIVILLAVPFSLIGALWLTWLLGYNLSLAVVIGMIALAGLDAETGMIMLLYLDNSYDRFAAEGRMNSDDDLRAAIHDGAVKRIRPKTMTVAAAMLGLLPLMWAAGSGADTMRRVAAPMIGGLLISFLMELLVYPVIFYFHKRAPRPHAQEAE
jgi:Cu(I)/Ag(I) efflux system membrane protein CusA/SilA